MSARRPLLTALGATTLLAALWFVPSANATAPGSSAPGSKASDSGSAAPESANAPGSGAGRGSVTTLEADPSGASPQTAGQIPLGLADTGGIDTTPYLLGGTLCLGLGAGFVTFSVRRSRA